MTESVRAPLPDPPPRFADRPVGAFERAGQNQRRAQRALVDDRRQIGAAEPGRRLRELEQVVITDLREGTFFAELVLRGADDQDVVIDCRPSDAIAILVRLPGTALAVEDAVLEEAGS